MINIYIPYNNDKQCVYREQAFSAVYKYYSSIKDFDVKVLSSTPFSRAAARNAVFEDRLEDNETVFFSDADIIVSEAQVREAVSKASQSQEMILAYTNLSKMNAQETRYYILTGDAVKNKRLIKFQCSGSFAIPVTLLRKIGGWDERFIEWGCEDRVFFYLAAFLRDKVYCQRLPGIAYHLFHPRSENARKRTLIENSIYREYLQAFGISVDTLKSYKKPNLAKIWELRGRAQSSQQDSIKEIIPFQSRTVVQFKKKRKVVLVLKDTKLYKKLLQSKEYEYEGVAA